jgi:hypothetical protein
MARAAAFAMSILLVASIHIAFAQNTMLFA